MLKAKVVTMETNNSIATRPSWPAPARVLPSLGTDLHYYFTNLAKIYGPIYKLKLGSKLCFVISSPTLVKQVLRDHENYIFQSRRHRCCTDCLIYGGTDIAFAPYGPDWRKLRKVVMNHTLSNANVDACYALRKKRWTGLSAIFMEKLAPPIDFGEVAFFTSINTLSAWYEAETLQEEKGATGVGVELRKVVTEIIGLLVKPNVSDFFPMLARFDIQGIRRRQQKAIKRSSVLPLKSR
ncbi:unnamed protein product [Prunus armeniaca]|uniref:Cytochrome P450 n=1 Tax=Prunus armeniaca TaxID=36596 RepID=A0A6J5UVZ0_PRUAR|nr:unnamed protein product [Prunus armeniaca]